MHRTERVKIIVEETLGIERSGEPVTIGIPFPQGVADDKKNIILIDKDENSIPLQTQTLAVWPDKSVKWLLMDFKADCPPNSVSHYYLTIDNSLTGHSPDNDIMRIADNSDFLTIDTGKALFVLDKKTFNPFRSVQIKVDELIDARSSFVTLRDSNNKDFYPVINKMDVETMGELRSTIRAEGHFKSTEHKIFCDFFTRLHFYTGRSIVKIEFTIRNPKAARHPGGLWDLGDPGSIFFKDLSIIFSLKSTSKTNIMWKTQLTNPFNSTTSSSLKIYQDSSGGENWDSPNHVNRYGKVTNSFRGYKVTTDDLLEEGHRATPSLTILSSGKSITAVIPSFWQNFPKSIEADNNTLKLKLFPEQYDDLFELQGGEQKTHTVYVQFESEADNVINLDWTERPLIVKNSPEWYARSMALGYVSPQSEDKNIVYQTLVDKAIKGPDSFFELREKIDEYGWRNFGDVYASHEVVFYKGKLFPFVSHYNNQYDIINACVLQFCRSGDVRWFELLRDLARHVADTDIYHTRDDRPAYNGGHFWHTDHFMHAQTSTHRAFSKKNVGVNGMKFYGGGPSTENCYTTGLKNHYLLTGDVISRDAVIELAEWSMNRKIPEMSPMGIARKVKKIISDLLNEFSNAPGRGEANAINTLLDAYELTDDRRYLSRSETIIRQFISPADDIHRLNQQQIELRWFYLIFLQSVGKYLDVKDNMEERDKMYDYAKNSLLYHAEWMLKNEVPYKQMFHAVEIPSSTWPAHDVRKSAVFDYAYKYADNNTRNEFRAKAEYFFNKAIEDVMSFNDESIAFVRPLAVLMHYGVMHTYFQNASDDAESL